MYKASVYIHIQTDLYICVEIASCGGNQFVVDWLLVKCATKSFRL